MQDLIQKAVYDRDAAWELSKSQKNPLDIVQFVSELDRDQAMQLGMNLKRFPMGCDLTEIMAGTCASDLEKNDILGNCMLSDSIGASIHVCAYAFADIAESYGMRGIDLLREVREVTEVPLDLDHFGSNGPMRLSKTISSCPGECYHQGPPFKGCPRNRIHSRLLEKEEDGISDKEEWIKISSSVAINLTCVQNAEGHAAPLKEAKDVARLAKKYGKGVEAIMFIGDGYNDLIEGFSAGLEMGVDVFVLEGGPFNCAPDRLDAFARAVAMARILAPGKIVATNGAYEDECRIGLRSGLNAIISGFPKNHHGYMCGYAPGTARRGNFGLPRIMQIIKEEIAGGFTNAPIQKGELEALARAVKIVDPSRVYPQKIGYTFVGDAHWVTLPSTPLYNRVEVKKTVSDLVSMAAGGFIGDKVALLGGRFVSWVVAKELDGLVDEIIISDIDPWVEKVTVENLRSTLETEVTNGNSQDLNAYHAANSAIVSSTIPSVVNGITKSLPGCISLI
ncbi:MAG: 5,10-methenyltetrahydromethanopterin hydrogenase cofactor biosynthesis protein HmdC [Methanospirillum sp.]|uniref:5,10-methenyltetrahydromethanopterin hydrogenase cofactor biosynthesis protein HmdC n=1 Tax=Methanospirillum sp. TaxID=45200 RepID=UPI00236E8624|nr:5,10-methenyltetrahydromethanopterin hydrogenase cofactor biosynthesis protein HmdC [Methanospirillum sp.]MDD1727692.1 5,10-methenyltetrahydromethanopterin hydrogenase cofactor biosynthesis protein HmdC [Methanospirillum sp.]